MNSALQPDTPLRFLKGVGPRRAEKLAEQGLHVLEDLLYVLPFRYENRSAFARVKDATPGGPESTFDIRVVSSRLIKTRRRGFTIFEAVVADDTGRMRAVWFNQPYLERLFVPGRRAADAGLLEELEPLRRRR